METNENLQKLAFNLVENSNDWMQSLRDNIIMYISQKNISLKEMAELSGVSYETFKTFLYGSSNNCKLSLVVNLARALNISIDELVGAGTINTNLVKNYRSLPKSAKAYCEWAVNQLCKSCNEYNIKKSLVMMSPNVDDKGGVHPSHNNTLIDVSYIPDQTRVKLLMALQIMNYDLMPAYAPYTAVLIANDRLPRNKEDVVIILSGSFYILKTIYENDTINFYSVRDNKIRFSKEIMPNIIGYIVGIHTL